jgi:hypothetical protein
MPTTTRRFVFAGLLTLAATAAPCVRDAVAETAKTDPRALADEIVAAFRSRDAENFVKVLKDDFYSQDVAVAFNEEVASKHRIFFQKAGPHVRTEFLAERPYGSMVRAYWYVIAFERYFTYARVQLVNVGQGWTVIGFHYSAEPGALQIPQ